MEGWKRALPIFHPSNHKEISETWHRAHRNHIGFALRVFLRIERYSFSTGDSWFEAKLSIIREAVRLYFSHPTYTL